jgi:hypothetical protein
MNSPPGKYTYYQSFNIHAITAMGSQRIRTSLAETSAFASHAHQHAYPQRKGLTCGLHAFRMVCRNELQRTPPYKCERSSPVRSKHPSRICFVVSAASPVLSNIAGVRARAILSPERQTRSEIQPHLQASFSVAWGQPRRKWDSPPIRWLPRRAGKDEQSGSCHQQLLPNTASTAQPPEPPLEVERPGNGLGQRVRLQRASAIVHV